MAITAENLAEQYGISREDCDRYALKTQTRWGAGEWLHDKLNFSKNYHCTVKLVLSGLKKDQKIGFQYRLLLNAGQKYCRMLQREHSAILSTFIKLPFTIKTFVVSIFQWPLKTGFTENS